MLAALADGGRFVALDVRARCAGRRSGRSCSAARWTPRCSGTCRRSSLSEEEALAAFGTIDASAIRKHCGVPEILVTFGYRGAAIASRGRRGPRLGGRGDRRRPDRRGRRVPRGYAYARAEGDGGARGGQAACERVSALFARRARSRLKQEPQRDLRGALDPMRHGCGSARRAGIRGAVGHDRTELKAVPPYRVGTTPPSSRSCRPTTCESACEVVDRASQRRLPRRSGRLARPGGARARQRPRRARAQAVPARSPSARPSGVGPKPRGDSMRDELLQKRRVGGQARAAHSAQEACTATRPPNGRSRLRASGSRERHRRLQEQLGAVRARSPPPSAGEERRQRQVGATASEHLRDLLSADRVEQRRPEVDDPESAPVAHAEQAQRERRRGQRERDEDPLRKHLR